MIAASEPWKKTTFSNHSILSFHSQITLIITRYNFFTTTEDAMNVPQYSLFVTPKFWINILFRSSQSLSKTLEWPTKSIIACYLIFCSCQILRINPLSPNSDQDQFSLNDIYTLSRDLVLRINKMNTYYFALIFYQILSTHSLRKYIKISLENLYVDIMGLKGLTIHSTPATPKCTLQQRFLVFP